MDARIFAASGQFRVEFVLFCAVISEGKSVAFDRMCSAYRHMHTSSRVPNKPKRQTNGMFLAMSGSDTRLNHATIATPQQFSSGNRRIKMNKHLGIFSTGALALAAIRAASLPRKIDAYLDMPRQTYGTVSAEVYSDDINSYYVSDGDTITATYDGSRRNRHYTRTLSAMTEKKK